jgi:hypothetical protein
VLALVELDEGVRVMTVIRGADPDEVAIGMAVRVSFERVGQTTLPLFRPRTSRPSAPEARAGAVT